MLVPGEGISSSASVGETGDSTKGAFVIFSLVGLDEPERPLAIELASPPSKAEPEALGLSLFFSSIEFLILLLIEDRIDLEVLSFVSDLDMEGYCCSVSLAKLEEEPLFRGVLLPSLLFDCCWPIEERKSGAGGWRKRKVGMAVKGSRRFEE